MSPDVKLSKCMESAILKMSGNGMYQLIRMPEWSYWKPVGKHSPRVRTDTMAALEKRGIVTKSKHIELTEFGKTIAKELKSNN